MTIKFDEKLIAGEDWDLTRQVLGLGKVDIIKSSLYHNEGKFNIIKYLKKKAFYSNDLYNYVSKYGRNDPIVRKQLGFYYRYIGVFIESGKWKRLIRHPLLALGMFLLRVCVGIVYLLNKRK